MPTIKQSNFRLEPTKSFVDSSFFIDLTKIKLDQMKLDTSEREIFGIYDYTSSTLGSIPSISLNSISFQSISDVCESLPQNTCFITRGHLKNLNTIDEFKKIDKKAFLRNKALDIYSAIERKDVLRDPSILSQFSVISFADLKKYKFFYWFAFPLLHASFKTEKIHITNEDSRRYKKAISDLEIRQQVYIFEEGKEGIKIIPFSNLTKYINDCKKVTLLFIDTSTISNCASYVLGNLISALSVYGFSDVDIIIHRVGLSSNLESLIHFSIDNTYCVTDHVTGWERMADGRLGPKLANLGSLIDPVQLADQSVDLNLKLMRWRIAPKLDLDVIRNSRCLLLGSGTLGSYVARALLAWGVRKITFVDNGKVSFSNPVRQPLYTFEDCLDGGHNKAETAAECLKKIFPKVEAEGYTLDVPMAGHPVTNESAEKRDFEKLERLFDEHDTVFILMDSRETRWLPTVMGNAKGKIVIDAALGFDSYLVMRHGSIRLDVPLEQQQEGRLGCYFCNDVYAPSDSLSDRTLDQMCTVTRPGVAMMAASLAVELFISILQHKDKQFAPHSIKGEETVLGCLPHQMRGFLHNFEILKLEAKNFKYCSACSTRVIEKYNEDGWEFVKNVLSDTHYLEDLVGLTKFHEEAEKVALALDLDDSDDSIL